MTSSTIAIIITVITMILFFINKLPMSVVACISTLAMGILIPEMKLSQIYSGFGGSSIVMVAGMCIVGDALFQTGIAQRIGSKIASTSIAKNERVFIIAIVIICTIYEARFLSIQAALQCGCRSSRLLPPVRMVKYVPRWLSFRPV